MIGVTDHAMLAFVQHDIGIELELVRTAIAANLSRAAAAATALGLVNYNVRVNGVFYLVRRSVVVSIQPDDTSAGPEARGHTLPPVKGRMR